MPRNAARLRVMDFDSGKRSNLSSFNIEEATTVSKDSGVSGWINLT